MVYNGEGIDELLGSITIDGLQAIYDIAKEELDNRGVWGSAQEEGLYSLEEILEEYKKKERKKVIS